MKTKLAALVVVLGLLPAARAEFSVTLRNVHVCCTSCVKGVDLAVATAPGAAASCDTDGSTVTIKAPDRATAQKAATAIVAAGFFGLSSDPAIKLDPASDAPGGFVESLTVKGVHLCCQDCVDAVNTALGRVSGVKANTARKSAWTFEVTGNFSASDVFAALNAAGLAGKSAK